MWTSENRPKYNRDKLRYPSDLTDDEWSHIEPIIPPAKRGGRKRSVEPREIVNGLMYALSTGCQWRYVPKEEESWTGDYIFENEWQSFRTKKDRKLELTSVSHECPPGRRKVAVKVVDIFGNDTMTIAEVNVGAKK
jgi:transposase